MIFRKQLLSNDCYRTVLGCLTDTEPQDVPHFMEEIGNEETISVEVVERINKWLQERGLDMITTAYPVGEDPFELQTLLDYIQETQGRDIIYLLAGKSVTDNHVVICRGNKIIWDPSPVNSWIRGPAKNAYFIHYITNGTMRYNGPIPENQTPFELGADDNEDQISV